MKIEIKRSTAFQRDRAGPFAPLGDRPLRIAATVSEEMSAPIIYLQPAIVALESDGNVFGIGNTEEECITDAISTAFYHDDEDGQRYPCTREWIERNLASGQLYFLHPEDFDPSRQP